MSTASASCGADHRAERHGPTGRSRGCAGRPAAGGRAWREPHRHGRQLRSGRQRGAHRRRAAPVPARARHRHEGRARPSPGHRGECVRDGRPEHLRAACEGSLQRLRLERIDLYQLHRADPDVPYAESVGALKELREVGKIRHVGLSNVSVAQLDEARGIVDIASVQNRFNLADRDSSDVLDVCERDAVAFPGTRWPPAGSRSPAGRRPRSRPHTTPRPDRSRSPGCSHARRPCSRSPAPPRSSISRRTSPPRSSPSPTRSCGHSRRRDRLRGRGRARDRHAPPPAARARPARPLRPGRSRPGRRSRPRPPAPSCAPSPRSR